MDVATTIAKTASAAANNQKLRVLVFVTLTPSCLTDRA